MAYPQFISTSYINPSGNIAASGYYKSHITQEMANMFPYWTAIRSNPDSVAQQFMSPVARQFHGVEKKLSKALNDKFIDLAPVDEIDTLYRMKIPSVISFLNNQNIQCWTAPSGANPSGYPFAQLAGSNPDTYNQIQVGEISDLEEFYYHVLPTRLDVFDEEPYSDERAAGLGISMPIKPSGIVDINSKEIEQYKREHDITWAHDYGDVTKFLRQDSETMETYDSFDVDASGYIKGFTLYSDMIWWIGHTPSGVPGTEVYLLNISNPHPAPAGEYMDHLVTFDITNIFPSGVVPSGIDIDEEGHIWILDENRQTLYALSAMYDYFLVDKENRYIYFRECYSNPGVFVKPA